MNCPYCNSSTKVTNSRPTAKDTKKWRRRECKKCQKIWTTHEVIDLSTSHKVLQHDGSMQPFSRDKLFISIRDSLQHRKTALEGATYVTDTVLTRVLHLETESMQSTKIFEIVHKTLKNYDKTAAAVYKASHN